MVVCGSFSLKFSRKYHVTHYLTNQSQDSVSNLILNETLWWFVVVRSGSWCSWWLVVVRSGSIVVFHGGS